MFNSQMTCTSAQCMFFFKCIEPMVNVFFHHVNKPGSNHNHLHYTVVHFLLLFHITDLLWYGISIRRGSCCMIGTELVALK